MKIKEKVEQGKGTADHLMPLGYFLIFFYTIYVLFFLVYIQTGTESNRNLLETFTLKEMSKKIKYRFEFTGIRIK